MRKKQQKGLFHNPKSLLNLMIVKRFHHLNKNKISSLLKKKNQRGKARNLRRKRKK